MCMLCSVFSPMICAYQTTLSTNYILLVSQVLQVTLRNVNPVCTCYVCAMNRSQVSVLYKNTFKTKYSGTSPYGHLTSKKTSPLQSPLLSPKLYSTVQIIPCNKVTSPLRSPLPSPVGDRNSEVILYQHLSPLYTYYILIT